MPTTATTDFGIEYTMLAALMHMMKKSGLVIKFHISPIEPAQSTMESISSVSYSRIVDNSSGKVECMFEWTKYEKNICCSAHALSHVS